MMIDKPNNVVEMLSRTVDKFADKVALMHKVDGKYVDITYQQLWDRIKDFAAGLVSLGVKEGDKVAIIANSGPFWTIRSEEHTSELQSRFDLVCRLLLEKKKANT